MEQVRRMTAPTRLQKNHTGYDFLDDNHSPGGSGSGSATQLRRASFSFGGLRSDTSNWAELFSVLFKHNLGAEFSFAHREFEKKRGNAAQKQIEDATKLLVSANQTFLEGQQLMQQNFESIVQEITGSCDAVKTQLSKHTNYQEQRIRAAKRRGEHHELLKNRYLLRKDKQQRKIDGKFNQYVLYLDDKYASKFQYVEDQPELVISESSPAARNESQSEEDIAATSASSQETTTATTTTDEESKKEEEDEPAKTRTKEEEETERDNKGQEELSNDKTPEVVGHA